MPNRIVSAIRGRLAAAARKVRLAIGLPIRYQYPRFSIYLTSDHLLPTYQRAYPLYNRFLAHLVKYFAAGDVVFDVGANCGDTLAAMISASPALAYVCVEPDAIFFSYLERNTRIMLDAVPGASVHLVQALVGRHGAATALAGEGGTKSAHAVGGAAQHSDPDASVHRPVRLDDIAARQTGVTPRRFRLLKSDVDGYDYDVIESAGSMLDGEGLILFFECYAETDAQRAGYLELFRTLAAHGYEHFWLFDNYGGLIMHETRPDSIAQLLDYVWRQSAGRATRTISYFDILACRSADAALMTEVATDYLRD